MKMTALISILATGSLAWGHAHLVSPAPRSDLDSLKTPPCSVAKTGSPTTVTGGQKLTVKWDETVQHTGSFSIDLSYYPDATNDFASHILATPADDQDNGTVPHHFSADVTIPDVNCENCTLRLIQTMLDSHPQAPTYYYSCADIKIVGSVGAPTVPSSSGGGGSNVAQDISAQSLTSEKKFGGGCGAVASGNHNGPSGGNMSMTLLALLAPVVLLFVLRQRTSSQLVRIVSQNKKRSHSHRPF